MKDEVFQVLYEGNFVYLQMSRAKRGKGEGGGYDSRVNMFVIKLLHGANISNLVSVCIRVEVCIFRYFLISLRVLKKEEFITAFHLLG